MISLSLGLCTAISQTTLSPESPTWRAITASPKKVKLLYHVSGWTKIASLYPHC